MENVFDEIAKENAKKGARNLLKLGKLTNKEIADSLGLSVHEVKLIKEDEEGLTAPHREIWLVPKREPARRLHTPPFFILRTRRK